MTKLEVMIKPEIAADDSDEAFWNSDGQSVVREEASVGANYVEADDAVSKKDFLKSIGTCRKEARETKHFLRMAVRAVLTLKPEARKIWMEARELHLIFSKIWRSGRQ